VYFPICLESVATPYYLRGRKKKLGEKNAYQIADDEKSTNIVLASVKSPSYNNKKKNPSFMHEGTK
jgi:hypothetical protein